MEKEANHLYRRPQMTGQARDEEEDIGCCLLILDCPVVYQNYQNILLLAVLL